MEQEEEHSQGEAEKGMWTAHATCPRDCTLWPGPCDGAQQALALAFDAFANDPDGVAASMVGVRRAVATLPGGVEAANDGPRIFLVFRCAELYPRVRLGVIKLLTLLLEDKMLAAPHVAVGCSKFLSALRANSQADSDESATTVVHIWVALARRLCTRSSMSSLREMIELDRCQPSLRQCFETIAPNFLQAYYMVVHSQQRDQAALCALGNVLLRLGHHDESEAFYRMSMAQAPPEHLSTLINYAVLLQEHRGSAAAACALYDKALQVDPSHSVALSNYAHLLCSVGDYAAAEDLLKKALRRSPSDINVLHNYGCLLWEARQDFTAAERMLNQVLRKDPTHTPSAQALKDMHEARARAERDAALHAQALMAELEVGGPGSGRGRGGDGATGTASGKKKRRSKRREKCGVEGSERPADAQIAKIRQNSVEGCVEYPSASSPVPAVPAKLVARDEGESSAAANVAAGVGGQYPCKEELSHVVATQAAATCRVAEAKNNAQTCSRVASPPSSLQARAGQPDSSEASEDAAPGGRREGRREMGLEGMGEPVVMDATHGREGGTDNDGARGCDADSLSSHRAAEATGIELTSARTQATRPPPRSPAAMRHWLKGETTRNDGDLVAPSQELEQELVVIDDHGIMHVIRSVTTETPTTQPPWTDGEGVDEGRANGTGSETTLHLTYAPSSSWQTTGLSRDLLGAAPEQGGEDAREEASQARVSLKAPAKMEDSIYLNWRDRREGGNEVSAPLMGGERGEAIQRSVAEAAAAAREREARERAALLHAEAAKAAEMNAVREEKDQLVASKECCVCLEGARCCVLRPCNHLCVCKTCAHDLCSGQGLCPLCRQPVDDVLLVFM